MYNNSLLLYNEHMKTKKEKNLNNQVEDILKMTISTKEVMEDIKMNRIVIKNTYGNIELLKTFSSELATKIWKTQRIEKLLLEKTEELTKLGIKKQTLLKKKRQFLRQIGKDVFDVSSLEKDSMLTNDTLELEVARKRKLKTN